MKSDLKRLQEFTKTCREDMHEPDEQDIYAEFGPSHYKYSSNHVMNVSFDNADTSEMSYDMGFWLIRRKYSDPENSSSYQEVREWFNLANIIALARKAQL